jgi:hypothetical protein
MIALGVLAAWGPIVLAVFRAAGPRMGSLVGLLGGFLLLPRSPMAGWMESGPLVLDKRTIPGLAVALGIALFDRRSLTRLRAAWVDLPALAFVLVPLLSGLAHAPGALVGSINQTWIHLLEWGVPYAVGRLYFVEGDGPKRLGTAVAVAGLLYVPVVAFEAILGPSWYLAGMFYGINYFEGMVSRQGGWRPETLLSNGLELAEWMALAATLATWMWVCARWRPRPIPSWLPAPILIAASLAARGVYGDAVLAIGLLSTALTRVTASRIVLMALTLVPPAYLSARISEAWDGRVLVELARKAGNASTTGMRIDGEDRFIAETKQQGLLLGSGGRYPDWGADGRWIATLRASGVVGVLAQYAALLGPAAFLIWRRSGRPPALSSELGLALFVLLHAIDSLHNTALIVPAPLLCGALAGAALSVRNPGGGHATYRVGGGHATYRVGDVASSRATVDDRRLLAFPAVACLLYVFGHAPVAGLEASKFVGGLGAAVLFASVGAAVASAPARALGRVAGFALAFAALGVSFNLALHPSTRPVFSADILQGLALSGLIAAGWRALVGTGRMGYLALVAPSLAYWVAGSAWPAFPGSQYFYASGAGEASLFPVIPWLALTALGAWLAGSTSSVAGILAAGFAAATALAWWAGPPLGPALKFPMNPTYALASASAASLALAVVTLAMRWRWSRGAATWLGERWLLFFYLHFAVADGLARLGLTQPLVCWPALLALSVAATWLVSEATSRVRSVFQKSLTWLILGASTLAVGLAPGLPAAAVLGLAGVLGILFASRWDELATLALGRPVAARPSSTAPVSLGVRYGLRLALVAAILIAPEVARRLPAPIGSRGSSGSPGRSAAP